MRNFLLTCKRGGENIVIGYRWPLWLDDVDGLTKSEFEVETEKGTNAWLIVTLSEGKNREIRKLMKSIGLDVARLIRLSYGPFQLGSLKKGEVREVPGKVLKEQLGSKFQL